MNFILRPWKNSDLDSLVKYANNIKIADNMTNKFPHPYTNESGKAFIEFANQDNPVHVFAIEIDEETVGGAGIFPQTDIQCKNAELGYWIGEPFWGKGIITHVIREMVEFGFRTYPIDRIFARPFGSRRLDGRFGSN